MAAPAPHLIGTHLSLGSSPIEFRQAGKRVYAQIKDQEPLVRWPKIPSLLFPGLAEDRVLRNRHLEPVYDPQKNEVHFQPISSAEKKWTKGKQIHLPSQSTPWICRQDGTVSYAVVNTVTTCDGVNVLTVVPYPTEITALGEREDGSLIVGGSRGELFASIEGEIIQVLQKKEEAAPSAAATAAAAAAAEFGEGVAIQEITFVRDDCYLLKQNDSKYRMINLASREIKEMDPYEEVLVLPNGDLILLNEKGQLFHKKFNSDPIKLELEKTVQKVYLAGSDMKILIAVYRDTRLSRPSWDVFSYDLDTKRMEIVLEEIKGPLDKMVVLDATTLVTPERQGNIQILTKEKRELVEVGSWGVEAMLLLADGSVMTATSTRGAKIQIVTRDGEKKIPDEEALGLAEEKNIESLTELPNGSVAVKCRDSIFFLHPVFQSAKSLDYQIEKVRLDLKFAPYQLSLYSKLGELLEKKGESIETRYETYLSALQAALKQNQIYEARRFYRKARKLQPENGQPCEMLCFFLKSSPHQKLYREALLELYRLKKELPEGLQTLKQRSCKQRLLVGEGDFSFTQALLEKHATTHPLLPRAIIATELGEPKRETWDRVASLMQQGVRVLFGINGTTLHETFRGERMKRIHWNCPFGGTSNEEREEFKKVMPRFFQSSSQIQLPGDRIHVVLVQKNHLDPKDTYWQFRQIENPIVKGSVLAGYRLIRKRVFGAERYPGYIHVKTGTTERFTASGQEREFVFEKIGKTKPAPLKLMDPDQKEYRLGPSDRQESSSSEEKEFEAKKGKGEQAPQDLATQYFECSTDEDSSDYYED